MSNSGQHKTSSLLLLVSILLTNGKLDLSQAKNNTRQGKIFSLFSIVQFPNEACSSTSGTYSNGTCFTSSECSSKGGAANGNCAAGFGVCCVFSVSATGSDVSQNCTYIVNPGYPSNYAPTTTPATVSYTINKCSDDICRIRLDYDSMVLTAPNTVVANQGQCTTDLLTFTTTDRTTVPTIATYGEYPWLCGTNTGMHSYLDMSCTSTDTATLSFTLGDTTLNQWKIKVTQYSCGDGGVAGQQGCFQYHTGLTGTIQSYNLAGGAQIQGQNYKHCIRQEEGYCCIEYSVISYAIATIACTGTALTEAETTRCSGATQCINDFIIVPGVINENAQITGGYDRFCGLILESGGHAAAPSPIKTCDCPFELSHVTGIATVGAAAGTTAENGFQLSYSQIAGSC